MECAGASRHCRLQAVPDKILVNRQQSDPGRWIDRKLLIAQDNSHERHAWIHLDTCVRAAAQFRTTARPGSVDLTVWCVGGLHAISLALAGRGRRADSVTITWMGAAHDRRHSRSHHRRVRGHPARRHRHAARPSRARARRRRCRTSRASTGSRIWRPARLRDLGRAPRVRHQDADRHPGRPRRHAGSPGADEGQHPAGDDHRRRRVAGRRFGDHARSAPTTTREWVENAPVRRFTFFDLINAAPGVSAATSTSSRSQSFGSATNENLYLLDGTDFTAPLDRRGVAVAEHRRHRRSAGAVARRQRRVRQRRRRGLQHRHPAGLEPVPRRRQLLLPEPEPDRSNTDDDQDDRPALQPRRVRGLHDAARRADRAGTSSGSSGRIQYQKDCESQPGTDPEFPAQVDTPSATSTSSTTRSTRTIACSSRCTTTSTASPSARPPTPRRARSPSNTATTRRPVCCGRRSSTRPRWSRRATRASTASDHGDPLNGGPRIARRFQDLDTGHDHRRHLLLVRRQERSRPPSPARSPSTPTTSWAAATTSRSACSTTAASASRSTVRNDYIYTYGSTSATTATRSFRISQGGRMKATGVFVDDTIRFDRFTLNLGVRYDDSKGYFTRSRSSTATRTRSAHRRPSTRCSTGACSRRGSASASSSTRRARRCSRALRPLLPRHRDRRVRQHHAVDHADATCSPASTARKATRWTWTLSATTPSSPSIPTSRIPYTDQFIVTIEHQFVTASGRQ